jgi:hypothetical protein
MTIKREELLGKLKKCLPGIDKGATTFQGANCFVFHQDRLVTFNDFISVSVPFDSEMTCAVPAVDFYKVLNSFKAKDVELTLSDFSLIAKCGKATISVPLMEEKILSRFSSIFPDEMEWIPLPKIFKNALSLGHLKTGNLQISGPFIEGERLISTDQVVIVEVDIIPPMARCWLSNRMTTELLKYPDFEFYATNASWIHFKNEDMMFSCRKLMDENYPKDNVVGMMDTFNKAEVVCSGAFTEEVLDALRSATVFAEETDAIYMVNFSMSPDKLKIASKKHTGSFEQEIELSILGEEVSFHIDALKLQSVLSYAPTVSFRVLRMDKTLAIFISKDNWRLLMGVNA